MFFQPLSFCKFRKAKRTRHSRKKPRGDREEEDSEEAEEVHEAILAAKFEQKMKKRTKGLVATTEGAEEEEEHKDAHDMMVGTAFTEQTTTTELDRAREKFVQEQIERIREGKEPLAPSEPVLQAIPKTSTLPDNSRFVSGGIQMPDARFSEPAFVQTARVVPEVEIRGAEEQYQEVKKALEEQKRRDAERGHEKETKEPRIIHNYNALRFNRQPRPKQHK